MKMTVSVELTLRKLAAVNAPTRSGVHLYWCIVPRRVALSASSPHALNGNLFSPASRRETVNHSPSITCREQRSALVAGCTHLPSLRRPRHCRRLRVSFDALLDDDEEENKPGSGTLGPFQLYPPPRARYRISLMELSFLRGIVNCRRASSLFKRAPFVINLFFAPRSTSLRIITSFNAFFVCLEKRSVFNSQSSWFDGITVVFKDVDLFREFLVKLWRRME